MSTVLIRPAIISDIPSLMRIESLLEFSNSNSNSGFIINAFSSETLENIIKSDIALVAEMDSQCVGFILGAIPQSLRCKYLFDLWGEIKWNNQIYSFDNFIWIERMAVDLSLQRKGIGKQLIENFSNKISNPLILTAIVNKPIENSHAMGFYKKLGFSEVGTYIASEFRNLKPYQSTLLAKNLSTL